MAIGTPGRRKAPLRVWLMLLALVVASFAGAAIGLVWQSSDIFSEEPAEETVTVEQAPA